jgi:hypothetical protein
LVDRLCFIWGSKEHNPKTKKHNIRPECFPILSQLKAQCYLSLQLISSTKWFLSKKVECASFCNLAKPQLILAMKKMVLQSKSSHKSGYKSGQFDFETVFFNIGLLLMSCSTLMLRRTRTRIRRMSISATPMAKLMVKNTKTTKKQDIYQFPFLSQDANPDLTLDLAKIDVIARDVLKTNLNSTVLVDDTIVLKALGVQDSKQNLILKNQINDLIKRSNSIQNVDLMLRLNDLMKTESLECSAVEQPAQTLLKPVFSTVFRFNSPSCISMFLNFFASLPKGVKQHSVGELKNPKLKLKMFDSGTPLNLVNSTIKASLNKSVARFTMKLGNKALSQFRQTVSIRL